MDKKNPLPILIANWKMHKSIASALAFMKEITEYKNDFILCPPYTLLHALNDVILGGQDCSSLSENGGAFTGDISANMLKEIGCQYVIIGHSERRKYHNETSEIIKQKIINAHKAGLNAILCIGESITQREEGNYLNILKQQLAEALPVSANVTNTIIAYEPIWAIGTGKTANIEQIEQVHLFLSQLLPLKLIYGGSVNSNNSKEILSINNVDGLLIGGASLDAKNFIQIIKLAHELI